MVKPLVYTQMIVGSIPTLPTNNVDESIDSGRRRLSMVGIPLRLPSSAWGLGLLGVVISFAPRNSGGFNSLKLHHLELLV